MNDKYTIDDLELDDLQKANVLEWFARKVWVMIEESSGDPDYYAKSYDPLTIDLESKEAMSYIFHLETGGTVHPFTNLVEIEDSITKEAINVFKQRRSF